MYTVCYHDRTSRPFPNTGRHTHTLALFNLFARVRGSGVVPKPPTEPFAVGDRIDLEGGPFGGCADGKFVSIRLVLFPSPFPIELHCRNRYGVILTLGGYV